MAERRDASTQTTILGHQLENLALLTRHRSRLPLPTCPLAASRMLYAQLKRRHSAAPPAAPPALPTFIPRRSRPAAHRRGSSLQQAGDAGTSRTRQLDEKECKEDDISLEDFSLLAKLGEGSFGRVFLVEAEADNSLGISKGVRMALKQTQKKKARRKLCGNSAYIFTEKCILSELRGVPFCLWLIATFQSRQYVYHVTEYYSGGTLRHLIYKTHFLDLNSFRIFAAELVCAVGYLHEKGIVHRDIKPANIAIDGKGHIVLIDFGVSYYRKDIQTAGRRAGSYIFCSPEFFQRKLGHEFVDWWSVGVTFLMTLTWNNPFGEGARKGMPSPVLCKVVWRNISKFDINSYVTDLQFPLHVKRLLQGLLEKDCRKRLGAKNGFRGIKNHAFFSCPSPGGIIRRVKKTVTDKKGKRHLLGYPENMMVKATNPAEQQRPLDWEKLAARQLPPPFPAAGECWDYTDGAPLLLETETESADEISDGDREMFEDLNTGPYFPTCT